MDIKTLLALYQKKLDDIKPLIKAENNNGNMMSHDRLKTKASAYKAIIKELQEIQNNNNLIFDDRIRYYGGDAMKSLSESSCDGRIVQELQFIKQFLT
jgi:hypothetical protein